MALFGYIYIYDICACQDLPVLHMFLKYSPSRLNLVDYVDLSCSILDYYHLVITNIAMERSTHF